MTNKDFKKWKNRGFTVENITTNQLNNNGGNQMPMKGFSDKDKVQTSMDFWKYKENKQIQGIYSRVESDKYGDHVVLKVGNGEVHLPNLTALNGKLKQGGAKEGSHVGIEYLGQKKSKGGRLFEDFDVYVTN